MNTVRSLEYFLSLFPLSALGGLPSNLSRIATSLNALKPNVSASPGCSKKPGNILSQFGLLSHGSLEVLSGLQHTFETKTAVSISTASVGTEQPLNNSLVLD